MYEQDIQVKWQNIEIFGITISNFASHAASVYTPLVLSHIFFLLVCGLAIGGHLLNIKIQNNEKFNKYFLPIVIVCSFILMNLSGAYLYFLATVLYGQNLSFSWTIYGYVFFYIFYTLCVFEMNNANINTHPRNIKKYFALSGVFASIFFIIGYLLKG